ncbi:TPA: alanine--tRNA ligase [Legionella pneumophila]|uniref:Alanine--tRNA ligase n=3 Tax=Legionella pneumophila TaxID=446 RepID=SYA_LEGPH|nr:alanine--tRNA ligase [Legionella pneumophila]A5ICV6.1 RecName: Full=Alanine--tRNA ligase; AltName: Full=Alanyl-tRNA synthetase; Short=AlaRS [Legionella pneumophila str. Corby]Q5ZUJ9.1 RecName: Full=Alanine--tRNA ligase; AltName: Full=Alanyl-tRNA synthetase; Short=AlaRS [Legionella pneumophila subsp. pneumophila str. Philadelphia 1]AAU27878.1 alanyl tRNA synthetase [Legionella pneumophila subsp. pneumophila str. Philadelphia 1]ABQ55206.1 alanyl tRNA synthetase [Legionella pneumophila str. Cor
MKSSEIRQAFLNYFVQRGHQIVASSSLVPSNDPTLLFTNAGMVQFKDLFLGLETRSYQRAATAQRCVRAGGKHNDLENVGYTARHHTFFEMLGNFSFGDYFKREAIQYAWEFLTEVLHIPAERLWVTVYKEDLEAEDIWLKEMKVSPERFSRCGEKDNFWSMGDTGPCGPCTEIFYDHGPEVAGGPPGSPDEDGDRYIEIWNLVFMQFNRDREGHLHPLPKPSVDTGMGLERLAAVIQGVHSNYEIDSFQYLIKAIAQLGQDIDLNHTSLKVIADHIRSCSFLIVDGVLPSNEGRGYVLRRIIRRAVRHGNKLGLPSPFFSKLVQPLIDVMGDAYPELINSKAHIERILQQEENQFTRTLEQGLRLLQDHIKNLQGQELSGEVAFKLYDTYGFPIDLTADIIREQGLHIDMEAFNQLMQQQREQSQAASQFTTDYHAVSQLDHQSEFHGYEKESMEAKIIGLLQEGNEVKSINKGAKGAVILDHTPFYAESGGQVGDKGLLIGKEFTFQVDDTQKVGQAVVHYGKVIKGELTLDLLIHAQVDNIRRDAIRLNHTATHLLHAALKKIVGQHVQQRGSLVDAERARFDFSHFEALTPQQIQQIEEVVNAQIRANNEVITQVMDIESAKQSGAVALFGEKYSDAVRVLSMGDFSKELCGGTHARRTGDIGLFKIVAEYGIASGIRRIEMVTGRYALAWVNEQLGFMNNLAATLKTTPNSLQEKVSQLLLDNKNQEKMIAKLLSEKAQKSGADILGEIEEIKGINLLIKQLEGMDSQTMRHTMDQLKSRIDSAVIILFTIEQNKMNVIAGVSKNIIGKAPSAAQLVRHLCGKGGGRDDMAQGGGGVPEDLNSKIKEIKEMIEKI